MKPSTNEQLSWYVVRTAPGAQRPDPRDARFSKAEIELTDAGFSCYMPIEVKDIIHHRTKKLIKRWFPLIPGYVFVEDVEDFYTLKNLRSVSDTVNINGKPLRLRPAEIVILRIAEMKIFEALADDRVARAMAERRVSGRALSDIYPTGSQVAVKTGFLENEIGRVASVTGRQTIKIIMDKLKNLGTIELSVDDVSLVA